MFEAVDYLSRAYSTVHSDQKEINVVSLMFILFFEEKSWDPRRVFIFRTKKESNDILNLIGLIGFGY